MINKKLHIYTFALIVTALTGVLLTSPVDASNEPSLYFSPSEVSGVVGNEVTVKIMIDTDGQNVDGVTADFNYPSKILKVVDVSTPLSTFTNTAEESMATPGIGKISRFLIGEYYSGVGEVATVTFRFLSPGDATLRFADNAMITYAGNNVLVNTGVSSILGASAANNPPVNNIAVDNNEPSLIDPTSWSNTEILVAVLILFGVSLGGVAIYKRSKDAKQQKQ